MREPDAERTVWAPGRVNLIGEHIDYHGLAVLPMALRQRVEVRYRPRADGRICAASAGYGQREFEWNGGLTPVESGDWENYLRAAALAISRKWGAMRGIDATVVSDLPAAAGLSSSTALLTAFTLALLAANGRPASFEELMEILPDGEQFVGTRGGGMDHAAVLASRAGCASLIEFQPLSLRPIPIPADWGFLVAHSLENAEKSGPRREAYNARRAAGTTARERLGFRTYAEVLDHLSGRQPALLAECLHDEMERDSFLHVTAEALRVRDAARAMHHADAREFGHLLNESHASLRDRLRVSCGALDRLVDAARESGALGARLTGAGFGGCAVVFCRRSDLASVEQGLTERFYRRRPEFDPAKHLIRAEAASGALCHDPAIS